MANRRNGLIAAILAIGAAGLLATWWWSSGDSSSSPDRTDANESLAQANAGPPQLDCIFYRFTIERPQLEFLFNLEGELSDPRFAQLFIARSNGSQRVVEMKEAPYPEWQFDSAPEPKLLHSKIKVFDTSAQGHHFEPITIALYKYEPTARGSDWMEASLKSIHYQNLPGQCRQLAAIATNSGSG
ncbi:hypothetical protein V6C03_04630 [Methyloligella sp. 2.7D]|uniref:hypothetical protein n=1 Tax=unclassified Methyloligella TaxID=2625955 RepID=UPI00157D5764|nr:hypothetical protein [Methyloligella sp. GL2]QKP76119.1 hypothetical protein HT051_00800 [Methyloligella sp. GL2]